VIVVRDVGRWTTEAVDPLVAYLDDPLDTTALVLVAGGGQTSARLLNAVKKVGRVIDAAAPRAGRARTTWVTDRLKAAPVRFDAAAGSRLVDHLGEDLGRLSSVIDTLVSAYGEGAAIGLAELEPLLGSAGGVAPWDLTDAIDRGDATQAIVTARRMLDSKDRAGLQIVNLLQRHYLAMARLEGSGAGGRDEAAALLSMSAYPAEKLLRTSQRLGSERIATAVRWVTNADVDLKGGVSFGGVDLDGDGDVTDLTVIEVLVARLAMMTKGALRR